MSMTQLDGTLKRIFHFHFFYIFLRKGVAPEICNPLGRTGSQESPQLCLFIPKRTKYANVD